MRASRPLAVVLAFAAGAAAQSVPCFENALGTNIGAGDDTVSYNNALGFTFPGPSGPVTAIDIASNGFVWLGTNPNHDPACCSGDSAAFLAGDARVAGYWMDLYPPGAPAGGGVFFNAIPAGGGFPARAVITWSQCPEYFSNPNITAQVQLVSTGEIVINHDAGNVQPQNYHSPLVGVTQGGAAVANVVNFGTLPVGGVNTGTNPTAFQVYSIPPAYDLAGQTILFTPNGTGGYLITQVTSCAKNTLYGAGCTNIPGSFYENFNPASAFDLNNSSMTMINTGAAYLALGGLATYQAPSPTATPLAIGDDGEVTVALGSAFPYPGGSTPTLQVCSNGFVSIGVGNGTSYIPDVPTLLANTQTAWYCWHDYNETQPGSGVIKFEEVGSVSYVTWDGVWDYGGASASNASTWQMQFDRSTGNVSWVWQTMSPLSGTTGTGFLVGYSTGGPSLDPGNRDISATLPGSFSAGADILALALSASPSPRIGNTVVFTTTNVPAATVLTGHILSFGQINPGIDLGFLGAPGCLQQINTAGSSSTLLFGSPTVTHNITIPNTVIYAGLTFYSQSASLTPGVNPLGLLTSNGMASLINLF